MQDIYSEWHMLRTVQACKPACRLLKPACMCLHMRACTNCCQATTLTSLTPGCIALGEGVSMPAAMPGVMRGVAPGVMDGVAPIIGVAEGATPIGVSSHRDLCFLGVAPMPGVSPPAQPGVAAPSTCTASLHIQAHACLQQTAVARTRWTRTVMTMTCT